MKSKTPLLLLAVAAAMLVVDFASSSSCCCSFRHPHWSSAPAVGAAVAAFVPGPTVPVLKPPLPHRRRRRRSSSNKRRSSAGGAAAAARGHRQQSAERLWEAGDDDDDDDGSCQQQWQPAPPVAAPSNLRAQSRRRRDVAAQLLAAGCGWGWGCSCLALAPPAASASAASSLTDAAAAAPSLFNAAEPSSGGNSPCANGGLAPELPVPGAYQNACMELDRRRFSVAVPVVGRPKKEERGGGGGGGGATNDTGTEVVWLTVEQRPSQVGAGATGKAVWNSGVLLSRLLQRVALRTATTSANGSSSDAAPSCCWFTGKTVLELGCGAGLGSLTCALLGATRVYATDGNDGVVPLALRNAQVNRLDSVVEASALPWGSLPAADYGETADVVVGSDLTYSPGSWRALAETMQAVLKPTGCVLYLSLGHAGFSVDAEVDGFVTVAREMGLVQVASSYDPLWPFPFPSSSRQGLSDLVMQECVWDAREREIVESAGGVRVVLLAHKRNLLSTGRI